MKREVYVLVERDRDGTYIGQAPQLKCCYSQGETLEELLEHMTEAIELTLEDEQGCRLEPIEVIGLHKVTIDDHGAGS